MRSSLIRAAPVVFALVLIASAMTVGIRTTRGLAWPGQSWIGAGIDIYRDIASAQTMKDTGYGPDPTYLDEKTWYNPMTPGITAVTSAVLDLPVNVVATQIGAYINVLAPLGFLLLCAKLFDRWTAFYATAAFLFLTSGPLPSWVSATYSPWFMPVNFVQAVFYPAVLVLWKAHRSGKVGWYVAAGVAWGLVFLGHTGPALILGGMNCLWVMSLAWAAWRERDPARKARRREALKRGVVRFAIMAAVAIVVSAPFVMIIAGHYGLRIRNPIPSAYSYVLLSRGLPRLLVIHLTVPMAIALIGLVRLRMHRSHRTARLLVMSWVATCALFLAYSFVRLGAQQVAGISLPSIVPSFHFLFYLKGATAVLFGVGLRVISKWAWKQWRRERAFRATAGTPIAVVICVLLLIPAVLAYPLRSDFTTERDDALKVPGSAEEQAFQFLRAHVGPRDVVLAADRDGAVIATPTGAKVVAIYDGFSNPYVDLAPRVAARDQMVASLPRATSRRSARSPRSMASPGWYCVRPRSSPAARRGRGRSSSPRTPASCASTASAPARPLAEPIRPPTL
jgi:hypothetical protein